MAYSYTGGIFKGFLDDNSPAVGALLYTYASGTTTPLATFTDSTLGTPNANPVQLDSRGEAQVWLGDSPYTFQLKTAAGALIGASINGVSAPDIGLRADLASTASGKGAALVGNEGGGTVAQALSADAVFVGTGNDDSTAIQAFVDARKGKTLFIKNATFAGLLLSGSTYDNTRIIVRGHTLKTRATSGTSNFGGAWVGIIFQSCDGCMLDYEGNGNRLVQPDEEHIYLAGLAGVTNMRIPYFSGREIRGDGLYVSQASWTSSTATTANLQIGFFGCYNSSDDGRNALSLIAYDGVSIGTFESYKVGAVVGGVRQPGGLDVEPNFTYQTCNSLTIGSATVRSTGTTSFGVQGKGTDPTYCVTGFTVGALDSINTLGASATTGTWALNLFQVSNVRITGRIGHTSNTAGLAAHIDNAVDLKLDLTLSTAFAGFNVGESGWVRKSSLRFVVTEYAGAAAGYGIRCVGVTDSEVLGSVTGAQSASSSFAIQLRSNSRALTQTNVKYSVHAPKDTNNARGYRNEPGDAVAFSNCILGDCTLTGYASWTTAFDGFGVAGVRKRNINNLTDISIMPTDGGWTQGDIVFKSNPSRDANNLAVAGWSRITTGTGNVLNTDWVQINDWYAESGTWTPTVTFATPGDLAVTYSVQSGRWRRIADRIRVDCTVTTTAFAYTTASGQLRVAGLPVASNATANALSVGACIFTGITAATTPLLVARVDPASSVVGFFGSGSGAAAVNMSTTNAPSGSAIAFVFSVEYQV